MRRCLVWGLGNLELFFLGICLFLWWTHVIKVNLFLLQSGKLGASGLHVECGRRHVCLDWTFELTCRTCDFRSKESSVIWLWLW